MVYIQSITSTCTWNLWQLNLNPIDIAYHRVMIGVRVVWVRVKIDHENVTSEDRLGVFAVEDAGLNIKLVFGLSSGLAFWSLVFLVLVPRWCRILVVSWCGVLVLGSLGRLGSVVFWSLAFRHLVFWWSLVLVKDGRMKTFRHDCREFGCCILH
jgi:hypothetical protein